ncbi:uncharacterized protein LOC130998365 [Salvia miltiorrhiza]|uniref:uncharacterized protein LOC130998365 n=1 Tax=Salvia miltiorrhiza TaxID=226208 RepID=UPI0025AD6432|nr:uncharacterized protein LOC130998365 [Salvia miltiorrhiza]
MLCHYTHEIGTGEKYHFYGPSWALYVWTLERVPGFGHMVAASSGDPTAHPRCLRWTFRGKPRLHGLRDLFEGQGGVLPLEPDGDDLSNHYFISALTPGELSVSFRPPDNPLARGVQFPQQTGARVVEERGDEEDVPSQPRMTRSHSVRGPVRDARPHEPAHHSVDPGKRLLLLCPSSWQMLHFFGLRRLILEDSSACVLVPSPPPRCLPSFGRPA